MSTILSTVISWRMALLLALLVPVIARAQDEADTTWDDLGLDPEGFSFDENAFGEISTGWFPKPYRGHSLSFMGKLFYADVNDRADGIRPHGFTSTTEPFTWHNPYDNDEREILQPNSEEEEDDGYPTTNYYEYKLSFIYNLPLPAMLRVDAGMQASEGMLFSNDTSRAYLTLGGAAQPFKEVGVAYLKEYAIAGTAGVNIPIYGGFIRAESISFASYYYIFAGYSAAYAISSKGTQYTQIADAKDNLRYGNGADTLTSIKKERFEGLNRLRTAIEFGIGWNVATDFTTLGFEAFFSLPQTSVLQDVQWKQYVAGLRISIGWQWLPDKEEIPGIGSPP